MLELSHISKTFNPGTINEKTALRDVSLTLKDGEFVTVLGSNGAGKSTLFNAISGAFLPDSGRVVLDGMDMTEWPDYKRSKYIGQMFQDPMRGTAANGRMSPFSVVTKADRERFREQLSRLGLGLETRMSQPVGLLSGGQRQALTLLMATVVTPKLLLLDEHTAALDPATAEKVLALTEEIVAKDHITCMMITHNMQSALEHGSRTIMMDRGGIILDVAGQERAALGVADLLERFRQVAGSMLDNDRILLS